MRLSRRSIDDYTKKIMKTCTLCSSLLLFIIAFTLIYKSIPIIKSIPLTDLFLSSKWYPLKKEFGFLPFIMGTIIVTFVAMVISIPLSLLTSIYLSEYASKKLNEIMKLFIDLLAGIPSVIYGLWGITTIIPFIRYNIAPMFNVVTTGYCVLSAGIVLAVMVLPQISSLSYEVMNATPYEIKEISYALGATRWQTIKHVVFKLSFRGVLASILLGFSRAFGETMAVLMVIGNLPQVPRTIFDPAYPLPSLIANNYGEIMSIPLYDSALMFAALLLLVIVTLFTILSKRLLRRVNV